MFIKIIQRYINEKLKEGIADSQFGFKNGARVMIFALNVLVQRCLGMNTDINVCNGDLEKAFDKERHEKLVEILQTKNIEERD